MNPTRKNHVNTRSAFTLIEIMIGMAILVILTGLALPSFAGALENADVAALQQQLQRVRTSVDFYTFQHDEQKPGFLASSGGWSSAILSNQLQLASDEDGNTAAVGTAGFTYGPYLTEGVPQNSFNGLNTIQLVQPGGVFSGPDDSTGWVYWADSGVFRANSTGTTPDGEALFNL
jgi:prepilin-type N-terminal cleavage/methylation domain-containing protein